MKSSPRFSFEVFPPKDEIALATLNGTLNRLAARKPVFVSVTCGAGGTDNQTNFPVCETVSKKLKMNCIPHLTCVGADIKFILKKLERYRELGIRQVLALRGDLPREGGKEVQSRDGLSNASDLVRLIRERAADFKTYVAGYPEGHAQNPDKEADFRFQLEKAKLSGGAIITQFFFQNEAFLRYRDRLRKEGFQGGLIPGIFPVFNGKQIIKFIKFCGSAVPEELSTATEKYAENEEAMEKWGINFAQRQIEHLLKEGIEHFHLYAMNRTRHIFPVLDEFSGKGEATENALGHA